MSYKKNRHSCNDLSYHLVVVTKYRHPVIAGEVKDRLIEPSRRILEKNFPRKVLEITLMRTTYTLCSMIHHRYNSPP